MNKETTKSNIQRKIIGIAVTIIAVFALYLVLNSLMQAKIISNYYSRIVLMLGINVILAVSLNIVIGFTGQLTLGHAGFMSLGAYMAAVATKAMGTPFIVSLLLGALFAGVIAAIIGFPILRLKGDYLAICTLGFGEIIKVVIQNVEAVGGARGYSGIPRHTTFTWVFFLVVVTIVVVRNILKSSQGRAMISVREDEIAAEAMGINTTKYKIIAFAVGAFFAGLAGGLYGHYLMFIDPKSFDFLKSMEILTYVVFGGMGSLSGSVLGAGALTFLPELLRSLSAELQDYRMVIYALLLILLMIFRPQGLLGTKELSLKIFKGKKFSKKGGEKDVTA